MLEARTEKFLIDGADWIYQATPALAKPIAQAAELVFSSVTNGGKILVCGLGASSGLAQYLVTVLLGHLQRPRPPLAALCLGASSGLLTALNEQSIAQSLAQQLTALAEREDVLILIGGDASARHLAGLIEAAHDRELGIVALGTEASGGQTWCAALQETDVQIHAAGQNSARAHEIHLMALHSLCDAVDALLLGDE